MDQSTGRSSTRNFYQRDSILRDVLVWIRLLSIANISMFSIGPGTDEELAVGKARARAYVTVMHQVVLCQECQGHVHARKMRQGVP